MKIGSIVKCIKSFEDLREIWGFDYPVVGEILTVSNITRHPNRHCRIKGIVCLHFEEKPALCDVCDKDLHGKANFIELLPPINLAEELKITESEKQ